MTQSCPESSSKTVLTYGTFDLFHIGHVRLLQRLRDIGSRVIVGVSTDEFNAQKGKKTIIPYDQRVEILKALKLVDLVIEESCWEQKKKDIVDHHVDVFAMGDDWKGKFDELASYCEVIYLPRTSSVSSTGIKAALGEIYTLNSKEMRLQFEVLEQLLQDLK